LAPATIRRLGHHAHADGGLRSFREHRLRVELEADLVEPELVREKIEHDLVERAVRDDVVAERLRPLGVEAAGEDLADHRLVLRLHAARDFHLGAAGVRREIGVGAAAGGDDLASGVDERLHDRVFEPLVLGLDVEDPPVVLDVGVEAGDHAEKR
jgi:hypothetical protein